MARYRVVNKHIFRASTMDVNMGGTKADGTPNIVRQMGPIQQVDVGTILDDVTEAELAAASDRFELVDEEALAKAQQSAAEAGAPPQAFDTERGVHEPAAHPTSAIQKPPLTGDEVAAVKEAQQAVAAVSARHEEQQAQMDKELAEAEAKAYAEVSQPERPRGAGGRFTPAASTPASPAPSTPPPPPAPSAESGGEGAGRRRT